MQSPYLHNIQYHIKCVRGRLSSYHETITGSIINKIQQDIDTLVITLASSALWIAKSENENLFTNLTEFSLKISCIIIITGPNDKMEISIKFRVRLKFLIGFALILIPINCFQISINYILVLHGLPSIKKKQQLGF